jgi:hypothetical protein
MFERWLSSFATVVSVNLPRARAGTTTAVPLFAPLGAKLGIAPQFAEHLERNRLHKIFAVVALLSSDDAARRTNDCFTGTGGECAV